MTIAEHKALTADDYREALRQTRRDLEKANSLTSELYLFQVSLIREAYLHGGLTPSEIARLVNHTCHIALRGLDGALSVSWCSWATVTLATLLQALRIVLRAPQGNVSAANVHATRKAPPTATVQAGNAMLTCTT